MTKGTRRNREEAWFGREIEATKKIIEFLQGRLAELELGLREARRKRHVREGWHEFSSQLADLRPIDDNPDRP